MVLSRNFAVVVELILYLARRLLNKKTRKNTYRKNTYIKIPNF